MPPSSPARPSSPAIIRETDDGRFLATHSWRTSTGPSSQLRWKKRAHTSSSWPISVRLKKSSLSESPTRARRLPTPAPAQAPLTVQKKVAAQVTAGRPRPAVRHRAEDMERLERIVAEGPSVRTTEETVRVGKATRRPRACKQQPRSHWERASTALSDAYDTRLHHGRPRRVDRHRIQRADDLQRIADLILH